MAVTGVGCAPTLRRRLCLRSESKNGGAGQILRRRSRPPRLWERPSGRKLRSSFTRSSDPKCYQDFLTHLLRDEFFFLCEAAEQLDGYSFAGRIATKQSRSVELRNEDPPVTDFEKCAERRVEMYHADDGNEVVDLLGHLSGNRKKSLTARARFHHPTPSNQQAPTPNCKPRPKGGDPRLRQLYVGFPRRGAQRCPAAVSNAPIAAAITIQEQRSLAGGHSWKHLRVLHLHRLKIVWIETQNLQNRRSHL